MGVIEGLQLGFIVHLIYIGGAYQSREDVLVRADDS
jgi:hypothetical protein